MDNFLTVLLRLKEVLHIQTDKEVAEVLGMTAKAFNARKRRGVFPDNEVLALKALRPELSLDVDYIFTGIHSAKYEASISDASKHKGGVHELERLVGMYSLLSSEAQQAVFAMVQHLRWQEFERQEKDGRS